MNRDALDALRAPQRRIASAAGLSRRFSSRTTRRVVFGSDFVRQTAAGIDAVLAADFLTAEQKSDIPCGNAARFFRLPARVCAP